MLYRTILFFFVAFAAQAEGWQQHYVARMGVVDISAGVAGPGQVVLFGDSNTEMYWWVESGACKVVNAGFGGATTAELLQKAGWVAQTARPRQTHIMAGTNDIARNTSIEAFAGDLAQIVGVFQAGGSSVILWELPPTRADMGSAERRLAMNEAIRSVAMSKSAALESRHSTSIAGPDGYAVPGALLTDGIHLSVSSQKSRKSVIDEWSKSARCR